MSIIKRRRYTAAHWGSYQFQDGDKDLTPLSDDPMPSVIGSGWVSAAKNTSSRILRPAIRKGWLEKDGGANRNNDSFIEVSWDEALDATASELSRIRDIHGNGAIFGGSYGWSSAGRFHHAQSQMRRFLALAGGYVSSKDTYSHAAAEVLFPHIIGLSNGDFLSQMTAMPLITEHCEVLLSFGGISSRTAQITSSGTNKHEVAPWLEDLRKNNVQLITVSPELGDGDPANWWQIRPNTDTALILSLIHTIVSNNKEDRGFLDRYTSGWETFRAYVMGESDGQIKDADWAAGICDLPAEKIRALAHKLPTKRTMISLAWAIQRADHGEQPLWGGLALACVLGQIGQPGTGFSFGYGSLTPVGRAKRIIPWPSLPKDKNPISDFIPVARIANMIKNPGKTYQYNGQERKYPDIRLIWWTGGNPFHHHQDLNQFGDAWQKPETIIVNDHSWTATARRADIVLPATTPLERKDLMINKRDPTLLLMSPLFAPLGQARDDFDIFSDLSERLGFKDAFTQKRDVNGWLEYLWNECGKIAQSHDVSLPDWKDFNKSGRFDIPDADEKRIAFQDFIAAPDQHPLATESGCFTLTNQIIDDFNLADCPGHPTWIPPIEGCKTNGHDEFHLISGQPNNRLHAQNDQGAISKAGKINNREVCSVHPHAAEKLGLKKNDIVELYNDRGACLAAVALSEHIRHDCISLPTGAWFDPQIIDGKHLEVHGNPNVLTIDKGCSELSQGNIAHTCLIQIRKWTGKLPKLTVNEPPKFVHHGE